VTSLARITTFICRASARGLLLGLLFGAICDAADSDRARRLDEQREDAAVRKAQQEITAAQEEVRQGQQLLLKAQAAFRQAEAGRKGAGVGLQKTVDRLEEEHAESAGLIAARDQVREARAAFKEAASPIIASVQQGTAYQTAEKHLSAATSALEPEAEGNREEAARKAAAARATMRELERAVTDAEPRLKTLAATVTAAEAKLEAAQARFEKAVDQDADLKNARTTFAAAKAVEEKAEAALVRNNRGLLSARSKLARAQQSLQAKKIADQKDSNKPPTKKKAAPNRK
jgi:chromosome segregation ATPase